MSPLSNRSRLILGNIIDYAAVSAQRAFLRDQTLFRLIEKTMTSVAFVPFAVKVDFPTFNDYLLPSDKRIRDLRPRFGIDPGQCRTRDIHHTCSLMMAETFIVAEPDDFILLEVQEDRLWLPLTCNSAVRPESGN